MTSGGRLCRPDTQKSCATQFRGDIGAYVKRKNTDAADARALRSLLEFSVSLDGTAGASHLRLTTGTCQRARLLQLSMSPS